MADPPSAEEANFIGEFDGLAVQPLDRTFYALHMTTTYQENGEDFPMEFPNVNFTTDAIILDESFNDSFPNPTNDDAFQNPNCLPDCLGSESGLDLSQMNPNSFGQPKSQLMGSSDDASRKFNSTTGYCLGETPVSNKPVHFPLNLGNNSVKGGVVEKKLKLEGVNANISNCSYLLKRKKSSEDSDDVGKHQKSTIFSLYDSVNNDEDEKRMARKIRNRESAHLSRKRKKHYVEELENKFRILQSTIQHLNTNLSYAMVENVTLKAQLGGTSVHAQVPSPLGIYPYPPPWISYTPSYMMSRQRSQVPLVPIPKLKSQALPPAPKSSKKVEKKKSEVKTKKVASVSFLGVLFFMLLFGGLVPLLKLRYGGIREPSMSGESFASGFYVKHHGRVLTVDGPVNGTGCSGKYGGKDHSSHCGRGGQGESNQKNTNKAVDEFTHVGNGSDPLVASLYVPRNDKLVDIDGNLIVQSVLASEKAMAFHGSADKKNREVGLTVPGDLAPAIPGIHPRLYRSPAIGQNILGSEEKENVKSTMQEWYLEGLAGPLLSSDMCTEVFQFDASSSAKDISMEERQNGTRLHRNRRILNGPPVSLSRPSHSSGEQTGTDGKRENFSRNKSLSSLVVSILVDGDGDGIMGPKSVSRIFIVVLIDSVKYVTYSCMLPFIDSVHVAEAS
ncbi:hypothetical protein KY290_021648 [Solanum tuberosum]|uniref:BZIP domain-containing protein n=1 Tax=Solanum tuberosum TaxID=4113 RepID=A0ABQ7V598_SOLTU|nr:hypothetical protein KY290_021648 [Solanum tuberosum]